MKIEVNIQKKHFLILMAGMIMVLGGLLVYAQTAATNPGHSATQITVDCPIGGTMQLDDCMDNLGGTEIRSSGGATSASVTLPANSAWSIFQIYEAKAAEGSSPGVTFRDGSTTVSSRILGPNQTAVDFTGSTFVTAASAVRTASISISGGSVSHSKVYIIATRIG